MASTNSLGVTRGATSSSEAQEYYNIFQAALRDVHGRIEAAKEVDELRPIAESLAALRATLTGKTAVLPTYDQQTHEHNIKAAQTALAEKRAKLAPKSRFAFKRKEQGTAVAARKEAEKADDVPAQANEVTETPYRRIQDRRGEIVTLAASEQGDASSDLHLINLHDCIVDLRERDTAAIAALQIRRLERCVVLAGQVEGSVMVHECHDCVLLLACRQFRMHASSRIAAHVSTSSIATIEHCTHIAFAPNDKGVAARVQDFDHISTLTPSANWTPMTPDAALAMRRTLDRQPTLRDLPALLAHAPS